MENDKDLFDRRDELTALRKKNFENEECLKEINRINNMSYALSENIKYEKVILTFII